MNSLVEGLENISEGKLKSAYALNMCTVSVSQIVDYNDAYILEQEYDAILNNLNLEVIPKDEPLLKTLVEILNTITFFRIQEIKKNQLEKEYQQRIKNAIWSAVPNLSVIVSGSPIAIAMALATQIGTGYMNYRKEKNNALYDKEKSEIELQITAIEQLNSLRRELFSTAWRLADKYGFPDYLRLTERQIKQYNSILQDQDEYRKYARLEAIQGKFMAYPPFWYFFAHTALLIAVNTDDINVKENYKKKANSHFETYKRINKFDVLREDQLAASAYLEYVDLLLLGTSPDYNMICDIINDAVEKAGNANDVLQLCAIAYLRCGNSESAIKLLKILVNEDYNAVSNAKIVSRLYVNKYLTSRDLDVYSDYKILEKRVDPIYLFPMPSDDMDEKHLESLFISKQKSTLKKQYRNSINAYAKKMIVEFNSVIPVPTEHIADKDKYYSDEEKNQRIKDVKNALSDKKSADYRIILNKCGFKIGFINELNKTVSGLEALNCFKNLESHDKIIKKIEAKLRLSKKSVDDIQQKMDDGSFTEEDYKKLVDEYSYMYFTNNFFDSVKEKLIDCIDKISDLSTIENYDNDLTIFCNVNDLPSPDVYIHTYKASEGNYDAPDSFFDYALLGEAEEDYYNNDALKNNIEKEIKEKVSDITLDPNHTNIYFNDDEQFKTYFINKNIKAESDSLYIIRQRSIAIIDDITKKDCDFIFCVDGVRLVEKNVVRSCVEYKDIEYMCNGNDNKLRVGYFDTYVNKNIDINVLYGIISKITKHVQTFTK